MCRVITKVSVSVRIMLFTLATKNCALQWSYACFYFCASLWRAQHTLELSPIQSWCTLICLRSSQYSFFDVRAVVVFDPSPFTRTNTLHHTAGAHMLHVGAALDRIDTAASLDVSSQEPRDRCNLIAAAAKDSALLHLAFRAAVGSRSLAARLKMLGDEFEGRLPTVFSAGDAVNRDSLDGLAVAWAASHRPDLLKGMATGGVPNAASVWARMNKHEPSAWPTVDCTHELTVQRCVAVSAAARGWQSTGLFAVPGGSIVVSLPACDDTEVARFVTTLGSIDILWIFFLSFLLSPSLSLSLSLSLSRSPFLSLFLFLSLKARECMKIIRVFAYLLII